MHAILEADSHEDADERAFAGLVIRIALAVKQVARVGKVWGDRYHARSLTTPREVRHAIAYVLLNFRKHLRAPAGIDPRSSGAVVRRLARGPDPAPPSLRRPPRHEPGSPPSAGVATAAIDFTKHRARRSAR